MSCCPIDNLLTGHFSFLSYEQKKDIIDAGRPCPKLENLKAKCKDKRKEFIRSFYASSYESHPWLTGCYTQNKLFCWPCILFSKEKGPWTSAGFCDLNHLSSASVRHERSQAHTESFLKLKLFGKQKIDTSIDSQRREQISKHNLDVRHNREVIKRFIDTVCFLGKQELPLRGHSESESSLNRGIYIEYLESLRIYDPLLDNHLKTATVFRGTSPDIQNDLIQAIGDVMLEEIKRNVASASFVSILLNETSDISQKSQLSTVLRFVKDSVPQECFLGFTDVSADRDADSLFSHVTNSVEEFDVGSKLVGQTYDGASVISDHLSDIQTRVLEAYPKALFTHYHGHSLNLVLQQSVSLIKNCKIFFKTLSGLASFFSSSFERTVAFEEYVKKKLPSVAPAKWNFTSRLSNTVQEYSPQLAEFFESIIANSDEWDEHTVMKARGFLHFLNEFKTIFLLEVFSTLFAYTDVLYDILQTETVDIKFCQKQVKNILIEFQNERDCGYDDIWTAAENKFFDRPRGGVIYSRSEPIDEDLYRNLFYEIIDNISQQVNARYGSSMTKLNFFYLLSYDKYPNYKADFPQESFDSLKDSYGLTFDFVKLKIELTVLYASEEFANLHVLKLARFLDDNDLKSSALKEVYKLCLLILTIPATAGPPEPSFSALNRIHTYLRSTQGQDRLSHSSLSLMSVEKEILQKLRTEVNFYDKVIEKFLSKNRRIDLIYQ